jgi:hypothetical protein
MMKIERKRRHSPELFTGTMADVSFLLEITTLGIPTLREIERDWFRAGASPRK